MIKNPKIIPLIFILAIFSFVNSEFNHVSKSDQIAQTGPGIIDSIKSLFGNKKKEDISIGERLVLTEGYKKISDGALTIYYPISVKSLDLIEDYLAQQIIDSFHLEIKDCLTKINCQYDLNKKRSVVLFNNTEGYIKNVKPTNLNLVYACYNYKDHSIFINLEKESNLTETLAHEIAHMAVSEKCGKETDFPRGLGEGFSNFRGSLSQFDINHLRDSILDSQDVHSGVIVSRKFSVVELLNISYPEFENKSEINQYYTQSTSLFFFLTRKMSSEEEFFNFAKNVGVPARYSLRINSTLKKYGFKNLIDLEKQWYAWENEYFDSIRPVSRLTEEPIIVSPYGDQPLSEEEKNNIRLEAKTMWEDILDRVQTGEWTFENFDSYINSQFYNAKSIIDDPNSFRKDKERAEIEINEIKRIIQQNLVY